MERKVEVVSTEFENVKKSLLEAGILKEDTPVYRVGEIAEAKGSRFFIERFTWVGRTVIIRFRFLGEKEQDEDGELWDHRVRLIIDGERRLRIDPRLSEEGDDYVALSIFKSGIPDSYQDYLLVLISVKDASRKITPEAVKEGDVAFIITEADIVRRH